MIEMSHKVKHFIILFIIIGNFKGRRIIYFYMKIEFKISSNSVGGPLKMIDVKIQKPFLIGGSAKV